MCWRRKAGNKKASFPQDLRCLSYPGEAPRPSRLSLVQQQLCAPGGAAQPNDHSLNNKKTSEVIESL